MVLHWKGNVLRQIRKAKINTLVLVILIAVAFIVGMSLYLVRKDAQRRVTQKALAAGQTAFENGDWPAAVKSLNRYIKRQPDDLEALRQYAQAAMSVRPLSAKTINRAISAYERLRKLRPAEAINFEKLAVLYQAIGHFKNLASIAQDRMAHEPNDLRAGLWLAHAHLGMNKAQEARNTLQGLLQKAEDLPEKSEDYVQACIRMSQLVTVESAKSPSMDRVSPEIDGAPSALDWLNRAVAHAPDSVEAQVHRAQYYIQGPEMAGLSGLERRRLARQDLASADALGTDNPQLLFRLGTQWLSLGELDRAAAELQKANELSPEKLEESFYDLNQWFMGSYVLATEIARKRGDNEQACLLADEILGLLETQQYRARVLPTTIQSYVWGGQIGKARTALEEYREFLQADNQNTELAERYAALQALVAEAEGKPKAVIQTLERVVGNKTDRPELWRMIAKAYVKTNQTKPAINALQQYLRLRPQDTVAMAELARMYGIMGDWANAYSTQAKAESLGHQAVTGRVLRIAAGIHLVAGQSPSIDGERLQGLSAELSDLRQQYPEQVDVRILQAIIANAQGEPQQAEQVLKLAIEECEEPVKAELQLVDLYQHQGDLPKAIALCQEICQRHANHLQAWGTQSGLHQLNQDDASARECLMAGRAVATEALAQRALTLQLAQLELVDGTRDTGIQLLWALAEKDPNEIQARRQLLAAREIRENPGTAQHLINELRAAEGENAVSWQLHQASLWLASEQWMSKKTDIKEMLQSCCQADHTWSAPVLLLADMYTKLGDAKQLEETYRQALNLNPAATVIAEKLLALLERQDRFSEAEEVLKTMGAGVHLSPSWRVRIALGSGDISRALRELTLQIANDPQDVGSRIQLAQLHYQASGDTDQALAYLQKAEAIDPNSRALIAVKASILNAAGRKADAIKLLNDYVAKEQTFAAFWMRAVFLNENGDTEGAEQDCQRLLTFTEKGDLGYELLSQFYVGRNRRDQALVSVEAGLEVYPQSQRLKRRLMHLLFQRGDENDQDRAMEILTELEQALPGDTELMTVRAQCLLQNVTPGSLLEARQKLERAIRADPTAVQAYLLLIDVAMRERDFWHANKLVLQGLRYRPDDPVLLLAWGRVEMALGHHEMAADLALQVLKKDIHNAAALALGIKGAVNGNNASALEEMLALVNVELERDRENADLWTARSQLLVALERPSEAIPDLEVYCQTQQGRPSISALTTLADLYQRVGNLNKSNDTIQRAEQLAPKDQAVVHVRAMWLVRQARFSDLREISSDYVRAQGQNPARVLRAAETLLALEAEELKTEAVQLFRHAVSLAPQSSDARLGLASSLYQTGEPKGAVQVYRDWLDQQPESSRALNGLSWILQEHYQQYDEALALIDRAIDIEPDGVHLLDTRGTILTKIAGRLPEARRDFMRIHRLTKPGQPRQVTNLLKLGRVCVQLNAPGQALQYLDRALTLNKDMGVLTPEQHREIAGLLRKMRKEG